MSFSTDIKQEIANNELEQHCKRAQLSALTKLTSSLIFSSNGFGLSYTSESPTTSKRTVYLLKELYDAKTQLEVARKTNLKKNNVYTIEMVGQKRDWEDGGYFYIPIQPTLVPTP